MRIAAAQISCSLGDPNANALKIRDFSAQAKKAGVDLIVFPEMTDTGYSMSVIQTQASPWTRGFVPQLQEIARGLSIAIVSGVSRTTVSRFTIRKSLSMAMAKLLANIERFICSRASQLQSTGAFLQAVSGRISRLPAYVSDSASVTTFGFRRCTGSWL